MQLQPPIKGVMSDVLPNNYGAVFWYYKDLGYSDGAALIMADAWKRGQDGKGQ